VEDRGNGERIGGWEPPLEKSLVASGKDVVVLNYGVGGESTEGGVNRIDQVLNATDADYVLILEGTNDLYNRVSAQTVVANLEIMADKVRDYGAVPVLATLTPDTEASYKPIETEVNPLIRELVQTKDLLFCDQYKALIDRWDEYSNDGLHPNRDGYDVMAAAWYGTLALEIAVPEVVPALLHLLLR
jgi:acyl-CoA thioesterase-1